MKIQLSTKVEIDWIGGINQANGKPNGVGLMKFQNGGEYYGNVKDGKFQGDGHMAFSNGYVYNGNWDKGKFHGRGLLTYPENHSIKSVDCDNWSENKKEGRGIMKWTNGTSYNGYFKNNKQHGYGRYKKPGMSVFKGQWMNGMKHGDGVQEFAESEGKDGSIKINGEWRNNEFFEGGVEIWTWSWDGDVPRKVDHSKQLFNNTQYIGLIQHLKDEINLKIKQMMGNSNKLLQKYGNLIFNGDKQTIKKFKIKPDIETRYYAVRSVGPVPSANETLSPEILFNPFVALNQNSDFMMACLAHEAAHVDKGHLRHEHYFDKNSREKDPNLSNTADDLIINEELKQEGIMSGKEPLLFLEHSWQLPSRKTWKSIILDSMPSDIYENDLTEDRIYEILWERRNEFKWKI